jgi:F-type H+-transporting ATPase subunit epsilon
MLHLEVITPTGSALSFEASTVTAPGIEGEFQVLPAHLPALVILGGGRLSYRNEKSEGAIYLRGGVAEVSAEGHVLILTEEVQTPESLDTDRAHEIQANAQAAYKTELYLTDDRLNRIRQDLGFAEAIIRA